MAGKNVSGDFFDTSMESSSGIPLTKKEKKREREKRKLEQQKKVLDLKLNVSVSEEESENEENDELEKETQIANKALENTLEEINNKLNNVLTKSDTQFIKSIIKETVSELKESLLSSVVKRIEIVEGELHEKQVENDTLKEELEKLHKKLEEKDQENKEIKDEREKEKLRVNKIFNDHDQYSRKNNLRITSVANDEKDENSLESTEKVVNLLNKQLHMSFTPRGIDISHRIGAYNDGKNRPIIVKFVHRQIKQDVLKSRRHMKNCGSAIFEDMSRLNSEILAATRKKLPDSVDQSLFANGSIFVKWKGDTQIQKLEFKDYQYWQKLDWPKENAARQN